MVVVVVYNSQYTGLKVERFGFETWPSQCVLFEGEAHNSSICSDEGLTLETTAF